LRHVAWRVAAWQGLFVAAVTATKSASNAIFLARADPLQLPVLYIGVAVVVAAGAFVVARLGRRFGGARLLTGALLCANGVVLLVALGVYAGIAAAPAVLYVVGEAYATLLSVLFWTRLSEGWSVREQKRAIGVVQAGGMTGAVVGGLLVGALAGSTGALAPAVVLVTLTALALPLLSGLRGGRAPSRDARRRDVGAVPYLLKRSYPRSVAVLVVTLAALGATTDFAFRLGASHATDEAGMAALFGWLNAGVGVLVVAFQLGVTRRLLARLGVFPYLAIVPAALLATAAVLLSSTLLGSTSLGNTGGAGAVLGGGLLAGLIVLKGLEMAGAFSLFQAGLMLLYNPMPERVRAEVRAFIDGGLKKAGAAAAGIGLLALAALTPWKIAALLGGVFVLAALALAQLLPLRRRYLRALDEKLGSRQRTRHEHRGIDAHDRETRRALLAALHDAEPRTLVAALAALHETTLPPAEALELLAHDDERVREAALTHVPADAHPQLIDALLVLVRSDVSRRPRREAVRALARAAPGELLSRVEELLADPDPGVVCATIEAAWGSPLHALVAARLDELTRELRGASPAWRREVAGVIGRVDDAAYDATLAGLLDDEEPSVRVVAARAAGRERHAAHMQPLVSLLASRATRSAAREALVAYGDEAVPALASALDDTGLPLGLRIHLPRVLAGIGSEEAAHALLFSNPRDKAPLQRRIADRLVELHARHPEFAPDERRLNAAALRRVRTARGYDEAAVDLEGEPAAALLLRVARERHEDSLRMALMLLGLMRGMDRLMAAYRALVAQHTSREQRHDAVELTENALAGHPAQARMVALLEHPPKRSRSAEERVTLLLASPDALVRAIARQTMTRLGAVVDSRAARQRAEPEDETMDVIVERLFALERVDLFEGLTADDLAAIAALAHEVTVEAGERIYAQGEAGENLFVIVSGEVELTHGAEVVLHLGAGESLGQVSFLDRGPRPVTAHVCGNEPARLLTIDRGAFLDLMSDRPGLMRGMFTVLAARLRALIDREPGQALG